MLGRGIGSKKKCGHPQREEGSCEVFVPGVYSLRDYFPHQHDWNDLGGLSEYLCWKADKLEGFVLAPAAESVGDGRVRVLVERNSLPWLLGHGEVDTRDYKSQDSINKHQELRISECFTIVLDGHHSLLQKGERRGAMNTGRYTVGCFLNARV